MGPTTTPFAGIQASVFHGHSSGHSLSLPWKASSSGAARMLATSLFIVTLIGWIPGIAVAETLEVCTAGCTYRTIASGLENARAGDIVWVRAGRYRETGPVRLKPGVTLRGEDPEHPERTIIESVEGHAVIGTGHVLTTTCVLEGFTILGGSGRGMYIQDGATEIIRNNVFSATVTSYMGAAMRIDDEGTAPTITSNTFVGNRSALDGGAIYVEDSSPLIIGNRFILNQSGRDGGAIAIRTTSRPGQQAIIADNEFSLNTAYAKGGAVYVEVSRPVIRSNVVISNTAHAGAGIYINGPNPRGAVLIQRNRLDSNITNGAGAESVGGALAIFAGANCEVDGNLIKHNQARRGDGMYIGGSAPRVTNNVLSETGTSGMWVEDCSPSILNNTIVGDPGTASTGIELQGLSQPQLVNNIIIHEAYGIRGDGLAAPIIRNNDVWANSHDYYGVVADASDLHTDPLLSDVSNDDYHLQTGSPMVDAGDPEDAPPVDFEGQPRPMDGDGDGLSLPDIGADEMLPPSPTATLTASPAPSPTATWTVTSTPTATLTPTTTQAQTLTPTLTATGTAAPTATPQPVHLYLPILVKP